VRRYGPRRAVKSTSRAWPLAVIVIAAACSSGEDAAPATEPPPTAPPTTEPNAFDIVVPPWEPATRVEQLASEISNSPTGATLQQAIDSFGLLEPDFPGVTPSELPAGEIRSGTSILRLIQSMRGRLTDEQRDVLDAYLAAGSMVARVSPDGEVELDAPVPTGAQGWRRAGSPTPAEYGGLLAETRQAWIDHLPDAPGHYYELWFTDAAGGMDAHVPDGEPDICVISVHAEFTDSSPSADTVRWLLAHELFHCMQFRWAETAPFWNPHLWVSDGTAEWATADLFRDRSMSDNNLFEDWFTDGERPLAARQYDAWPLYENAYLDGHDVYGSIIRMFREPVAGVWPTLVSAHLDGLLLRLDWTSRTLRDTSFGDDWWLDWPWLGQTSFGPTVNARGSERGLGFGTFTGQGKLSQLLWINQWTDDVDVVTVFPQGSPFITSTASGTAVIADGSSGTFCFDPSGCICPDETGGDIHRMPDRLMIFAFAAVEQPPRARVFASEFDPDEHCDDEEYDDGSSNGDPHLVSFDGLPFDVVTLGELVLARDPTDGFEVQTRHEPIGFGAGTTAVAISAGEHRITFTMPDFFAVDAAVVRVDGEVVTATNFRAGDVGVVTDGVEAELFWPDGSVVELEWYQGWFVRITVPRERGARMDGLLGAADGDLRNDLRMTDGSLVDTSDAAAPESPYALSWAVDAATTLFDYEPGQSVATFRIPHPTPEAPLLDAQMIERCATTLGEEAAGHDVTSCAYDVAATGEPGFVDQYADIVGQRASGVPEPPVTFEVPATRPDASIAPAVGGESGVPVLTLGADEAGTIDAVAGTVLVARTADCAESYVGLLVAKADESDVLARADLCDPSGNAGLGADDDDEWVDGEAYVWIPGDGAYDVGIDVTLGDPSAVGPVELYLDPDPAIVDTAALTDGETTTLRGIGDTAVYFPDPADTFTVSGLDVACATDVYWGDREFPNVEPFDLDVCEHRTEVDFPPTDLVIPVVAFNRTAGEVAIALTPSG
jgi:VWD domain-containing protein